MKLKKIILVFLIVLSLVLTSCRCQEKAVIEDIEVIIGVGEDDGDNPAFIIRHDGEDLFNLTHGGVATFKSNLTVKGSINATLNSTIAGIRFTQLNSTHWEIG